MADIPILVTGGAGYIGSHVCKALKQCGFFPVTIDNLSLGHRWAVKWGPLIEGDIGDHNLVKNICEKYQIKGLIHLAAFSNVRESMASPLKYYENNVGKTIKMLSAIKGHVEYFVFSSTCAIYGKPKTIPICESHEKRPITPYGASKLMVEQVLETAAQDLGLNIALLRYFNAAGADIDGEIGEAHENESHLIPLLLETHLQKRPSFTLYGSDHPTDDGTAVRDFIHVTDLADAHIKALTWMMENKKNLKLNLGTGQGYSVLEVIHHIEKAQNAKIPVKLGKRFEQDPPVLVADSKVAKKILNWIPQYSTLPKIIETACRWHET